LNNDSAMNSSHATATGQIRSIIAGAHAQSAHLLDVLHALQQQFLHISREAVVEVAAQLDLPVSQVESVVEFYSFFHQTPRGRYDILLSNCTSCGYLATGGNLLELLCQRLNVAAGRTRADGLVSIGQTSCIGMCDHGAALLVNGMPLTHLDSKRIEHIAALVAAETPLADWPAGWFKVDDNVHKSGLLLEDNFAAGESLRAMPAHGGVAVL
jgi:[NiFe] hydrogenase diaphorase moiety large subunit